MSLRQLLTYAHDDPAFGALSDAASNGAGRAPERAFVSQSLRPYLVAALADAQRDRPALIVTGDDRSARDLAADLRAFLRPRLVRLYPARGVRYESQLAPPPHLVGLRVAALDSLAADPSPDGASVVVASAAALAEKVPDPALRPHGFAIEKGGVLDLEETADQLVACGYERVDQVEDRGQFAIRGDILDVYPATEERAVRCELFDIEVERLTFFSTFTQRSLEEADRVEIAPAAEIGPEHREAAEIAALEADAEQRPDIADVLPVDRFCDFMSLVPENALVAIAQEEEIEPSLVDYWQEVTTSFHDADAHHLYLSPDALKASLAPRTRLTLSSIAQDQPHEFRAQGADTSARSLREAEPELEKLVRSGYRTIVAWARRGEG
jgi:transcription-repair coupling factor (superfamily II helicase)